MKRIIILASLGLSLLMTTSCQDEFLEASPTETAPSATPQQKLNGIYVLMVQTGSGGTNLDHDDFGQKGYDIYGDLMSSDMALEGVSYGWYSRIASTDDQVNATSASGLKVWRFYYKIINAANDVIKDLGGTDYVPTSEEERHMMGQAKTLRAYAYFYLLQYFTPGFDASAAAIPIYTAPDLPAAAKSTQQQVYDLIIDDLTKSISYLSDFQRENKGMVNQAVAKGILAYTYAAMGRNADAAVQAKSVINDYSLPLTTRAQLVWTQDTGLQGGFNDLNTNSWMWGFDIQVVNGLDLVSWWGQVDRFTYSYAAAGDYKGMDNNLYSTFTPNNNNATPIDYRKDQFQYSVRLPVNKFYDSKRVIMGQRQVTADYLYMRVDEFYLLAAETLAKIGQETEAKTILKKLLENRYVNPTQNQIPVIVPNPAVASLIDPLSGVALQDEIYRQTRIELWGEGKSYLALKRNKATVVRGSNHLFLVGTALPYNDPRMYFKIPQREIDDNPNF